jgi:hypothetical protein
MNTRQHPHLRLDDAHPVKLGSDGATTRCASTGDHFYRFDPVEAPGEDRLTTIEALADLSIYQGLFVAGAGFEPATFGL